MLSWSLLTARDFSTKVLLGKNATHGDGSGDLVYALEIDYIKEGKRKT